jgi:hypothetical protein
MQVYRNMERKVIQVGGVPEKISRCPDCQCNGQVETMTKKDRLYYVIACAGGECVETSPARKFTKAVELWERIVIQKHPQPAVAKP